MRTSILHLARTCKLYPIKMSGEPVLYWGSGSIPCWKPMLCLAEKGVKYQSNQISFSDKGHKQEPVTALNPRGQVPTFKHGDVVVNESTALCLYLEDAFPDKPLVPKDMALKGKVLQKAFEADANMQTKAMLGVLYLSWQTSEDDKKEQKFKDKIAENKTKLKEELNTWNGYLGGGNKFVVGDSFTLADVYFFPFLAFCWRMSLDLTPYPNLKSYFDRMREYPSVKATWPPHWTEGDPQPEKMALLKDM